MIQALLAHDAPLAIVRSLGIYSLSFSGKECFPILVLDGSMGELHQYIGGGSTLSESLEIAVDYIEHVAKHGNGFADNEPQWEARSKVS